jgi:hypothetical protein
VDNTPAAGHDLRPGHRGDAERLHDSHPTLLPLPARHPDPDADPIVHMRLNGHPDAVAALLPVLAGLRIVAVGGTGDDPAVDAEVEVHGTIRAGEHAYLSTACLHEALDPGNPQAADWHAYCDATQGACGEKTPATCKWCRAACRCSEHDGNIRRRYLHRDQGPPTGTAQE